MTMEKIIAHAIWILINAIAYAIAFIPGGAVLYVSTLIVSQFVDLYTFIVIMLVIGFLDTALMVGIQDIIMHKFCKFVNKH